MSEEKSVGDLDHLNERDGYKDLEEYLTQLYNFDELMGCRSFAIENYHKAEQHLNYIINMVRSKGTALSELLTPDITLKLKKFLTEEEIEKRMSFRVFLKK